MGWWTAFPGCAGKNFAGTEACATMKDQLGVERIPQ
jgi:hypothetical protein